MPLETIVDSWRVMIARSPILILLAQGSSMSLLPTLFSAMSRTISPFCLS